MFDQIFPIILTGTWSEFTRFPDQTLDQISAQNAWLDFPDHFDKNSVGARGISFLVKSD